MALPTAYLITTKNLETFLNTIITAQAPDRFTYKFLESLELKSTNDRLLVGVIKSLKLLDESGVPTDKYFEFLDQTKSKQIIAESIKETYSDLFATNINAHELTASEVKNKFKTLDQGKKSEKVLQLMASTFTALCEYADWDTPAIKEKDQPKKEKDVKTDEENTGNKKMKVSKNMLNSPSLNYNIQIHLPETRDASVYDAIFKSLKDHLL